jgi:hypothetical protein
MMQTKKIEQASKPNSQCNKILSARWNLEGWQLIICSVTRTKSLNDANGGYIQFVLPGEKFRYCRIAFRYC